MPVNKPVYIVYGIHYVKQKLEEPIDSCVSFVHMVVCMKQYDDDNDDDDDDEKCDILRRQVDS